MAEYTNEQVQQARRSLMITTNVLLFGLPILYLAVDSSRINEIISTIFPLLLLIVLIIAVGTYKFFVVEELSEDQED